MSIQLKPHLKEVNELYNKINSFDVSVRLQHTYSAVEGVHHYIKEDVRTIIDTLSQCMDLDPGELDGLQDAMHSGKIDFMLLVHEFESIPEDDYQLIYIMSRPFFRSIKNAVNKDDVFWQDGRCPVCTSVPVLSTLEKESRRTYYCSFCGTRGYFTRIACLNCLTDDPQDITVVTLEGEEGMRADTCDKCMSYSKSFEGQMTADNSMDELDIISLTLDIVVQEKGYKRLSPNPVGMMRME
jgi:FdhE protein